jgi:hypothetical protein
MSCHLAGCDELQITGHQHTTARDPSPDRMPSWDRLGAGTDLLGAWLVDVVYGHIGARGRRIRYLLRDKDEAWKLVRRRRREISLLLRPFRASYLIYRTHFATISGRPSLRT